MAKARVIGVQHKEGVSKKGNNYNADILHVEFLDTPRAKGFTGHEVGTVWCTSDVCPIVPKVGATVDVYYSRTGYVEDVLICN